MSDETLTPRGLASRGNGTQGDLPVPAGALDIAGGASSAGTARLSATSRGMWRAEFGVLLLLLFGHIATLYGSLQRNVPRELVERLDDDALLTLSVRVGLALAALLYPFAFAALLGIASLLERRVFDASLELPFRQRIGAFHCLVVLCVIGPASVMVLSGQTERLTGPVVYVYVAVAVAVVLWLFRPAWRALPFPRKALIVASVAVCAGLVTA